MVDRSYILGARVVAIEFTIEPFYNALGSLQLLNEVETLSGFSEWVTQTAAALPPALRRMNFIVLDGLDLLFFCVPPLDPKHREFMDFVNHLSRQDPVALRARMLENLASIPLQYPQKWLQGQPIPTAEQLLCSQDAYVAFMHTLVPAQPDLSIWQETHRLIADPPAMLDVAVTHLKTMWEQVLAAEWARVQPMLQESVDAFKKLDFAPMTAAEAIRRVTERDLSAKFGTELADVERVVFIPSAHIGPYISKYKQSDTLYIVFGARLPRDAQTRSSALSRSDLLIRLNALADDTRLRILELLTQHEELCAQDIIERLGLSQSTVSRHLSQLAATGYITERRREVAKCYSLNTDRVVDTLRALTDFLSRR